MNIYLGKLFGLNNPILILLIGLLLSACSTTRTPLHEATEIPFYRVSYDKEVDPLHKSTVVFVRDQGLLGGGCYLAVSLNDKMVGRLDTGEKLTLNVRPGLGKVGMGRDPLGEMLCGLSVGTGWHYLEADFKEGETHHFKLGIGASVWPITDYDTHYISVYEDGLPAS